MKYVYILHSLAFPDRYYTVSGGWRPLRRRLDFGRQRAVTEDIQAARATCSREAAQAHGRSSLSRLFGQRLTRRTRTWAK